jgi:hypothetical protein
MMMLTTHGLFLTCMQKFYLYIYTTALPPYENDKGNPTYLEGRCFADGGEYPIHSDPLPGSNCPPFTF